MNNTDNTNPSSPVIKLCQELVRIPSPSGQEGDLARFVAAHMRALGMHVEIDRYGSVLGIRQGQKPGPTLILDAHLDTVPITRPAEWQHSPTGGEIDQGRLWGRGSADTKGSLAAMICAAASIPEDAFSGTLIVSASICEEDMTTAALEAILERHPADCVVVGEPTSLRLGVAQKGRAGILVEANGRSAHTSRPELGDNAIYKMMEAIARIRALPLPNDPEMGSGVCELIEIDSEPRPSIGTVPHRCTARLALRLLPGESRQSVSERIAGALCGMEGMSLKFTTQSQTCWTDQTIVLEEFIPAWKNADSPLQREILDTLQTTAFAAPYTTNASAAAARGIPTFLLGPGAIDQAHTIDEWISLDQLNAAVDAYTRVIRTCLKGQTMNR